MREMPKIQDEKLERSEAEGALLIKSCVKWQRGTVQLILLATNASFGWSIKEIKVVQQNLSSYYRETNLMQQFS